LLEIKPQREVWRAEYEQGEETRRGGEPREEEEEALIFSLQEGTKEMRGFLKR
jgi:hypothetical protein